MDRLAAGLALVGLLMFTGAGTGVAYAQRGGLSAGANRSRLLKEGGGSLQKFRFVSSSESQLTTTNTGFTRVPDMLLEVKTKRKGAMVIQYYAEVYAEPNEQMMVEARVDGAAAMPGEVQLCGDSDEEGDGQSITTHSFVWVVEHVTRGTHQVEMVWRSASGGPVWTHSRTMIVMYKK